MPNVQHLNGLSAELYVASVLAGLGFYVYFPAMSQSRCDMIAEEVGSNTLQKVQVKKLSWNKSGTNKYLSTRLVSRNSYNRFYEEKDFDVLCLTDMDRVWVIPFEVIKGMTSIQVDKNGPTIRLENNKYDSFLI